MGRIDNTKLFYISGGLMIGLILLALIAVNSKTSSFLNSGSGQRLQVAKTASGKFVVNGAAPTSTWKRIGNSDSASAQFKQKPHDSGYKPGSSYANDYVRAQDVNYPLIASAKFIKKKDKLKNKKKKNAAKLSKKSSKPRYDEHGNLIGLSESAETYASITTASTSQPAKTAKKNKEKEDEEDLNTVEFWIDPIFNQQDPNAVNKLIDAYQARKVSATVFNELVAQMTEDERAAIRGMSLDAMSASPSTNSFTHLSWMKHNDTEPALRTEAGRQVASYADANRLNYVIGALKASDNATVTAEALRTLTASTKKYGGGGLSEQGEEPAPTPKPTNLNTLEPRYTRALEVIEQNGFTNSNDTTVKTEATKTVAAINKFMTI